MQLRLAFAVAAHLEAQILLVDEVLAVGDAEFQKKCVGKMEEVSRDAGRTIVFVSHNFQQLKSICNTGVWIDAGKLLAENERINDVIDKYTNHTFSNRQYSWEVKSADNENRLTKIFFKNKNNDIITSPLKAGDKIYLEIGIHASETITGSLLSVRFTNSENVPIFTTSNGDESKHYPLIKKGDHLYKIHLPVELFIPGQYSIIVAWIIPQIREIDSVKNVLYIDVEDEAYAGNVFKDGRMGLINKPITWAEA
jgi:lipopolysaccharide transport system ATP-binding protein